MYSTSIHHVTVEANAIGKQYGVVCRYQWDRKNSVFDGTTTGTVISFVGQQGWMM